MDSIFATGGEWLANAYLAYGLIFLAGGAFFCLHLLVLVLLCVRPGKRRFPRLERVVEVVYGLINPLIYLLFLEQPFDLRRYPALAGAGWTALAAVWAFRLWGGVERARRSTLARHAARSVLGFALLCVGAFLVKDAGTFFAHGTSPSPASLAWWIGLLYFSNVVALYAIPVALLTRLLRLTASEESWSRGERFFLLSPRLTLAGIAALAFTVLFWNLPRSQPAVESQLLANRAAIVEASARYQLDPRLIASVVYVVQRDDSPPLARQLEHVAMGAWVTDSTNDMGFAEPLDLSVGVAQIRPFTALAALVIYNSAAKPLEPNERLLGMAISLVPDGAGYKQYRGLPDLDARWHLPATAVAALHPTFIGLPSRRQMVEDLFDDRQNLEMCGLILALYAAQWQNANPAWDIHDRPEILATLYQLGFERSSPKANPRPIKFGERVRAVYESDWMKTHFGTGPVGTAR